MRDRLRRNPHFAVIPGSVPLNKVSPRGAELAAERDRTAQAIEGERERAEKQAADFAGREAQQVADLAAEQLRLTRRSAPSKRGERESGPGDRRHRSARGGA
jgi:hypothetical protein